jgi:hypothetical protein
MSDNSKFDGNIRNLGMSTQEMNESESLLNLRAKNGLRAENAVCSRREINARHPKLLA